jgi:hypothetical protein
MTNQLEAIHLDTCLPDYWSGHHLPHIQIAVYQGMTIKAFKESALDALNQDAIAGDIESISTDYVINEDWYKKAVAAIRRITPAIKGTHTLFKDLDTETGDCDDCRDSVYAFVAFEEL